MFKHMFNFHPRQKPNFTTKATRFFSDPLTRQVNKGIKINNTKSNTGLLMNSKSEFQNGVVARVMVNRRLENCSWRIQKKNSVKKD